MKFEELQLSKPILSALEKIDYKEATPIQSLAIPKVLEKKDIIGIAQTGTGKTAAFALPIIERLIQEDQPDKRIKVLILSPTRELALQIRDSIRLYTTFTKFKCSVILGGVNQKSQVDVLTKGIDILVATPGRLLDLIEQGKANISNVKMLVLDEADTMLDMGFIKDIKSIIRKTPKTRQTLLFSATMPNEIRDLSVEFMMNPLTIKTKTEEVTADRISQQLYYVDKANKINLLLDLIDTKEKPTTLIFTRTKHGANHLAEQLEGYNINCSVIHGNKTQSNRVKALSDFKSKKNRIMIATDIAARGIDIDGLELVINYDMPEKAELYVHRIGRTARAGHEGIAISLCSSAEINELKAVERLIKQRINVVDHKYPMVLQEKKEPQRGGRTQSNGSKTKKSGNFQRPTNSSKERFSKFSNKNDIGNDRTDKADYKKNSSSRPYTRSNNTNSSSRPYTKSNNANSSNGSYTKSDNRNSSNGSYTKSDNRNSSSRPYSKSDNKNSSSRSYVKSDNKNRRPNNSRFSSKSSNSRGRK